MGGDHAAAISGGTPSCANSHYLRGVLRNQWGWKDGLVVSDCQAIAIIKAGHGYRTAEDPHAVPKSQIHGHEDQSDYVDAARQAIRASTDFNCGQDYRGFLEDVVVDGSVNESVVDESLFRMYNVMHQLGIVWPVSADTADGVFSDIGPADIDTAHNRAIAKEAILQAITLLKNDEQTLPLSFTTFMSAQRDTGTDSSSHTNDAGKQRKLAVLGPLANATLGMLSNYHPNSPGQVPVAMHHSPLQALQARGIQFDYVAGSAVECETPHYCNAADRVNISAAASAAANADTVLLFLGMNPNGNNGTGRAFGGQGSSETEAKDRYDIKLRGVQQELLDAIVAANSHVVVVLMNAGCLALNASLVPAVLSVYYPGELGGDAIVDVLGGTVSPAGRLPITYYPAEFVEHRPMQEYDTRAHGGITYRFYEGTPLWYVSIASHEFVVAQ